MKTFTTEKNIKIILDIMLGIAALLLRSSLGIVLTSVIMTLLVIDMLFNIKGKKNDIVHIVGTAILAALVTYRALVGTDTYWFFVSGFLLVFLFAMIHEYHINRKTAKLIKSGKFANSGKEDTE